MSQLELLECILCKDGTPVVMANSERLTVPESLRFIWEVRHLSVTSELSEHQKF